MNDRSTITIDCTNKEVSIDRDDFQILSGEGVGSIQPIPESKSFLVAEILSNLCAIFMEEDREELLKNLDDARELVREFREERNV